MRGVRYRKWDSKKIKNKRWRKFRHHLDFRGGKDREKWDSTGDRREWKKLFLSSKIT